MAADDLVNSGSLEPGTVTSKKRKSQIDEIEVDLQQPEPPSKKAKRLLKKGKSLPVKPNSDDEADEDGLPIKTGKDGKAKSKRSEYGVWIGNLPWSMTRVDLFKWLIESSGGAITQESITRVNLPTSKMGASRDDRMHEDRQKPQNKGFAYVDFDTEATAVAAMALTETELDGRKLLIKRSTSFEGRPKVEEPEEGEEQADGAKEGAAAGKKKNTNRKIHLGNLGFQTTEEDLWQHFEKCGQIDWVKVATFEDSGKCKGYGWVKFREEEAAEWAVKGFVRIKEDIETEDDFRDSTNAQEDPEEPEAKKFKMRKWWVNRLKGRELKIEFAEDDQVRYKKRYGKGGSAPAKIQRDKDGAATPGAKENAAPRRPVPAKAKDYGETGVKSYLTGSVVKSEGKKITFD